MESQISNGMCRCCASQGTFKDVRTAYHWMGEEEVYSDMLRDCLDVTLCTDMEGNINGGICEVCITQLRNAANFKRQVLDTEEQFKLRMSDKLFKQDIVKVELAADNDDSDRDNLSDNFSEYEVPIKMEDSPAEVKPKKRKAAAKASTSRVKKTKTEAGESSKRTSRSKRDSSNAENEEIKLKKNLNFSSFIAIKPAKTRNPEKYKSSQPVKKSTKNKCTPELELQFENIKKILSFSNTTPFRCYVSSKFVCSYCFNQYSEPKDLKIHTKETHENDNPDFFETKTLSKLIMYMDITDLKCVICDDDIDNLTDLINHLKRVHGENMHFLRSHMVSFKFQGKELKCVMCDEMFDTFPELQSHTITHYKNYKCEFCKKAFLNREMMIEHKRQEHNVVQKI